MIYLDNNATTRLDPRVLDAMMPFLTDTFANASSTHPFGVLASNAVKIARQQVANLLCCDPHELVFTSGATEAINLAIKGVAETAGGESVLSSRQHIVTVQTEHKAVLDVCGYLETRGFEITYLPVQPDGTLEVNVIQAAIRPDTLLVCVMLVNNETGVIQPIREITQLAHAAGALFMTDATQAVGKLPIDLSTIPVDLLTFSAHKFYGPKGVGGLFVRQRRSGNSARIRLEALLHGGGHERGLRSGTLNVPGIVGLGKAAALAGDGMGDAGKTSSPERLRITALRDQLETDLLTISGTRVNGNRANRVYTTTNLFLEHCDSDALIMGLDGIAVSNGSACTAASIHPSHVLLAMGLSEAEAFSCLRFSLGRFTTEADIVATVSAVRNVVAELRAMVA